MLTETSERTDRLQKLLKKNETWVIRELKPRERIKIKSSRQSDISSSKDSKPFKDKEIEKKNRENFYKWGSTRGIMDLKRKTTAPRQED